MAEARASVQKEREPGLELHPGPGAAGRGWGKEEGLF